MSDTLYREVELPCSIEQAWAHVTNPSWLGDDGVLVAEPSSEGWVREGERTRYLVVEEVDEERHLAYRWASFEDAPSRVEIDLEPTAEGTRISIAETTLEAKALTLLATR